jgi:hypothetical protein
MVAIWTNYARHAEAIRWISFGVGCVATLTAIVLLAWRFFRRQPSPEELERRRRAALNSKGKIGDGEILDVDGAVIMYSYSVSGVEYTVGQDASTIATLLPEDRMRMVGPASIRFDPKNPPNSIVLCEEWSGLRLRPEISDERDKTCLTHSQPPTSTIP